MDATLGVHPPICSPFDTNECCCSPTGVVPHERNASKSELVSQVPLSCLERNSSLLSPPPAFFAGGIAESLEPSKRCGVRIAAHVPGGKATLDKASLLNSHHTAPFPGIYGMDFFIVLNRPGYRVAKRKAKCAKIGYQHKVTKTDAVKWFKVGQRYNRFASMRPVGLGGVWFVLLQEDYCALILGVSHVSFSRPLYDLISQAKFDGIVTG